MVKKLAALAGAGALLATTVMPAFAFYHHWPWFGHSRDVDVAFVNNSATAMSFTGENSQNDTAKAKMTMASTAAAGSSGSRSITTGNAHSKATAVTVANTDVNCGGGDDPCGCRKSYKDVAVVENEAMAMSDTGLNEQNNKAKVKWTIHSTADAGSFGNRTVRTGNAWSDADAWTVVNTDVDLY